MDPVFRERPDEYLDMLRSREPVHQDRELDRVVLTRAADVEAAMNNRDLASDPRKSRPGSFSRMRMGAEETFRPLILHMDDPDHKRVRSVIVKAFNQVAVDAMRPRITEVACDLLDMLVSMISPASILPDLLWCPTVTATMAIALMWGRSISHPLTTILSSGQMTKCRCSTRDARQSKRPFLRQPTPLSSATSPR